MSELRNISFEEATKDKFLIGRKTSTTKELNEWFIKDEDKKIWCIMIIDDDTCVIKKIKKEDIYE